MKFFSVLAMIWTGFCLATLLAEAGVLAVLWQRGQLGPHTVEQMLTVAYDIPVRDIQNRLLAKSQPTKRETTTYAELQTARLLTNLDLDLRELAADKGLVDLRELDRMVEEEKDRYTRMKDGFDQRWEALRKDATDAALQDVRRQIESIQPQLAKDQLLRILDDDQVDPETAIHHVVSIFKSLPIDKRKKVVTEFGGDGEETAKLDEILREIRLGMPQATLIREAREQLDQFRKRH
jgi:hypothetical protein